MKNELDPFKTEEVIGRIIKGEAEQRDFRLFNEIFSTNKTSSNYKDAILYSLKDTMSQKAFHQLVRGLLEENKEFAAGSIPNASSLAGKVLRIEAQMHQDDLKENDSNVQHSLRVIINHYLPKKVNNKLISSAMEKIYAPLIYKANPYESIRNEFEEYYYDSSGIGSDYGPTQEDINRHHADQYRSQQEHQERVLALINKAYNLSITEENKSLINNKLNLNDESKDSLEDFKNRSDLLKKLPKEVHDPMERKAVKVLNEKIIPQINKLAKTVNSKFKDEDIDKFVKSIGNLLISVGINDFDKQSATSILKEAYLEATKISNVSISDKLLFSVGSLFKQSNNSLLNKLGNRCHSCIDEASNKILTNNSNLERDTSKVLANALDKIGMAGNIRNRLINLEQKHVKSSQAVPGKQRVDSGKSQYSR